MTKRIFAAVLIVAVILSLFSCGSVADNTVIGSHVPSFADQENNDSVSGTTASDAELPIVCGPTYTPEPGGDYIWPCPGFYDVSARYYDAGTGGLHGGIDIAGDGICGACIVAADNGTVSSTWYADAGWGGGYGIYCVIDHSDGKSTLYAHMSTIAVAPGQQIAQGQVIGYVGSTGDSTTPHLHFETWLWGVKYDPLSEY